MVTPIPIERLRVKVQSVIFRRFEAPGGDMRHQLVSAMTGLALCATLRASEPAEDRHEISGSNPWSLTDSTCAIDEAWDDGAGVVVSLHEDHYDLGVYDPGYKGVAQDKVIGIKIGAGGTISSATSYQANGVMGYKAPGYVAAVQPELLDRLAKTQVLRLYRDGDLISDFNIEGFSEALEKMRSCEAAFAADMSSNVMDAAMNAADTATVENAVEAAAAAANAAEAAANAPAQPF